MDYFLAVSISFFLTFISLPIIINVFNSIDLLDIPDRRKIHKVSKPSLGGLAIIGSLLVTLLFLLSLVQLASIKFFLAGILMVFVLGIRDDISSLDAKQKVVIQLLAAILVVQYAGIYLTDLQGFMGIFELHPIVGKAITVFIIIALTNSFNLIDGIDGLASGIALLTLLFLGINFFYSGHSIWSLISISLASAIIAFLYFNWYPSKIFMGDTGSMSLGFILSVLLISFIKISDPILVEDVSAPIGVAVSMLIVPIYDTLRVFLTRLAAGRSPFMADKSHIHHTLLKLGLDHGQASSILLGFTFLATCLALLLQGMGNNWLVLSLLLFITLVGTFMDFLLKRRIKIMQKSKTPEEGLRISKSA